MQPIVDTLLGYKEAIALFALVFLVLCVICCCIPKKQRSSYDEDYEDDGGLDLEYGLDTSD